MKATASVRFYKFAVIENENSTSVRFYKFAVIENESPASMKFYEFCCYLKQSFRFHEILHVCHVLRMKLARQDFLIRKPPAVKLKVLAICIRLKARNLYLVRSEVTKPRIQDKYYIWY